MLMTAGEAALDPRKAQVWLVGWNIQQALRERRGAGDGIQSPMANANGPSIKAPKQLGSAACGLVRTLGCWESDGLEGAHPPVFALCLSSVWLFCCILYNKLVNVSRAFFWALTREWREAQVSSGEFRSTSVSPWLMVSTLTNSGKLCQDWMESGKLGELLGVGSRLSQIPVRCRNSALSPSVGGSRDTLCEAFSFVSLPCCPRKDWRQHVTVFRLIHAPCSWLVCVKV